MSIIEFIGFIISLAAMVFLFIKRSREMRFQREHPEEYARLLHDRESALEKLLDPKYHSQEQQHHRVSKAKHEKRHPTHYLNQNTHGKGKNVIDKSLKLQAMTAQDIHIQKSLQPPEHVSRNAPQYEVKRTSKPSYVENLVKTIPSRKNFLIYKEIFDKPLSMRNPRDNF